MNTSVLSMMKKPSNVINDNASVADAVDLIIQSQLDYVITLNEHNKFSGIINQHICQQALLKYSYYCDTQEKLVDVQPEKLVTLTKNEQLADVAINTAELEQSVFPVIENQEVIGVIERQDILSYLQQNLALCHA